MEKLSTVQIESISQRLDLINKIKQIFPLIGINGEVTNKSIFRDEFLVEYILGGEFHKDLQS